MRSSGHPSWLVRRSFGSCLEPDCPMRNNHRWSGRWIVLAWPLLLAPFPMPPRAFGQVKQIERKAVDQIEDGDGPAKAAEHAIVCIQKERPALTFIHLDHVDDAGHNKGHGTPEYYAAVAEADRLIGLVLQAVKDAGIAESTIVLVTSDHGGVGKKHGGNTMAE